MLISSLIKTSVLSVLKTSIKQGSRSPFPNRSNRSHKDNWSSSHLLLKSCFVSCLSFRFLLTSLNKLISFYIPISNQRDKYLRFLEIPRFAMNFFQLFFSFHNLTLKQLFSCCQWSTFSVERFSSDDSITNTPALMTSIIFWLRLLQTRLQTLFN